METEALKLYTTNDVCELLRISRTSFWRLRKAKVLPAPYELFPGLSRYRADEIAKAVSKLRPVETA